MFIYLGFRSCEFWVWGVESVVWFVFNLFIVCYTVSIMLGCWFLGLIWVFEVIWCCFRSWEIWVFGDFLGFCDVDRDHVLRDRDQHAVFDFDFVLDLGWSRSEMVLIAILQFSIWFWLQVDRDQKLVLIAILQFLFPFWLGVDRDQMLLFGQICIFKRFKWDFDFWTDGLGSKDWLLRS